MKTIKLLTCLGFLMTPLMAQALLCGCSTATAGGHIEYAYLATGNCCRPDSGMGFADHYIDGDYSHTTIEDAHDLASFCYGC